MKKEIYFERIEQYLGGQLSPVEQEKFETEVKSNAELRSALDLYRLSLETVDLAIENDLRQSFTKWERDDNRLQNQMKERAKIVRMRPLRFVLAAAASLVLVVGAAFIWANSQYSDTALLSAAYETPQSGSLRSPSTSDPLHEGWNFFQKEQYEPAADFLKTIPANSPAYPEAQFLLGHSLYQLANYPAAQSAFQIAANANDPRIKDKAEWGTVIACLHIKNEVTDCQVLITAIENNAGHSFHDQAITLQQQINSNWRKLVW